ncbi:TetR/AcrR family transcriptional regulator [Arthrobacter sp. ISL-69]|uniref:TetR/AcrR family transcriptional regulator n=1 Tax=Arthrobacter sp. ISL-69 TaxID=2819113 RepID=UPI001BE5073D|nr:TetR/AcrR family transcriptional regulator [Arthrobacter sp. ISL-69]MBT2534961.1 TetR/AcrR family transcriptional regulator [Arthrobacter sp. ISL-69]
MDEASRRRDVSHRILTIASDLFSAEGLYQVGINRIIAEAGVAKATFYKYSPTKDDLVLACVDELGLGWAAALRQAAGPIATHPADQLLGMFDALSRDGHPGDHRGAAFLRAAAEIRPGTAAHLRIALHNARVLDWITRLARQTGAGDPCALARSLALILEGGQAYEITSPGPDTPDIARSAARQIIRTAMPRPARVTRPQVAVARNTT